MINTIVADFRSNLKFKTIEVGLFRTLAKSIAKNSKAVFIDETHGNVCQVKFTSALGKPERCEIADLLIISILKKSSFRATFWQAKKETQSKWTRTNTGGQLDFKGQYNQWDLLCNRPRIQGVNKFNPPHTLLSSFDSPSIGSFGIFYEKANNIELSYSIAEFVSCHNPHAKSCRMTINGYLEKYMFGRHETISKISIRDFLHSLFSHQIGADLDSNVSDHKWLIQYVQNKLRFSNEKKIDPNVFRDFLRDYGDDDSPQSKDGLSILIIEENIDAAIQ